MAAFLKRLRKELQSLERSPDPDIALAPLEDNIRVWNVREAFEPSPSLFFLFFDVLKR